MMTSRIVRGVALAICLALAHAACGGKAQVGAEDGGAGSDGGGTGACVDVPLSSFDTSCQTDGDCTVVTTGHLCPHSCLCGGSAINVSSEAAWQKDVSGITGSACPCSADLPPRCVGGTCTLCNDPAGCGVSTSDAGTSTADAAVTCVDIPASTYSSSCSVDADCTSLPVGHVCSGQCDCGADPVNVSGIPVFQKLTQGLTFADCPCVPLPLACYGGKCSLPGG